MAPHAEPFSFQAVDKSGGLLLRCPLLQTLCHQLTRTRDQFTAIVDGIFQRVEAPGKTGGTSRSQ